MINKYIELHEKLMQALGEYYNLHIRFTKRPSSWTQTDLIRATMQIGRVVKEIKKNNLAIRKQFAEDNKKKKAAIAAKKEEKRLRKENGNNSKSTKKDV